VIDLHSHLLPGIDDGAANLDESVAIARTAAADGIAVLAATPHVRADYPTRAETMERLVARVGEALRAAAVPLQVVTGGELDLLQLQALDDDELRRFGLGGNQRYLLLETPYAGWPLDLEGIVFDLRLRGFKCVIAHPERNHDVQARPERLCALVEADALVQLTAASVDGRLGRACRESAFRLLDLRLAHMIASDAHGSSVRRVGMSQAAAAVGDEELAHWLTAGVPGAIVRNDPLPPSPARPRRGGRLGRLGRRLSGAGPEDPRRRDTRLGRQ
jgi:protein-tyrosine phosphatase